MSTTYATAERTSFLQGGLYSIGLHIFFVLLVALIAFLTGTKSLRELMGQSAALPIPPPPEEQIEVTLQEEPPPPPAPVELAHEIAKPPPTPPKPPPPKPKPVVVHVSQPPVTQTVTSRLVVGNSNFPRPGYPYRARQMRITGTCVVSVSFDGSGGVADVEVISSSGASMLDSNTVTAIRTTWHDPSFAGKTERVPIEYKLSE